MEQNYQLKYESESGGKVYLHPTHFKDEISENLFFAEILANKGKIIHLLPYVNGQDVKNPDAEIDGVVADFKHPKTSTKLHTAIQNAIRLASRQKAKIVVINLNNPHLTKRDLIRALIAAFQNGWNENIEEVWLLFEDL